MKEFNKKLQEQFSKMQATGKLFRVALTGHQVWDLYINSFADVYNPVFRDPNSSEHNCNHCKNFIRRYGNIVSINDKYDIETIFNVVTSDEYLQVTEVLTKAITASKVTEVFFETFNELNSLPYEACKKSQEKFQLGVDKNVKRYTKEEAEKYGVVAPNEIRTFNHMFLHLDRAFVDLTGKSVEAIMGEYRDAKNVFKRAMDEISLDTLELVRDLSNQGSLLDGPAHMHKVERMIPLKREYDSLAASQKDNWCWVKSYGFQFAKFRNELIGVLCSELSEGKELNAAVQAWNKRVDPANFMKVTAPVTEAQKKAARKYIEENGFEESFNRRFATLKDIKAGEILHVNSGDGKIKTVSIFDKVKTASSTRHKRSEFDKVEEVSIDKFMKDILPTCTSVEALLLNNHEGNMVTLTTADNPDSKPMFKWDNNYSWTFNGNLAGKSQIKDNVKAAGGKITGLLRCSLQWNDEDTKGTVDFDLHCRESHGSEIYYGNKRSIKTNGWLDVDMIRPSGVGIENITWQNKMPDMEYEFSVVNYCGGGNKGFKAEIEFGGEVFNYQQQNTVSYKQTIKIATITVNNGNMSIRHHLSESNSSKEIYGLETNQFHKVNLVCLSPNHWDDNNVGNKHYFFMLEDCKTDKAIRSFHSENFIAELAAHRKTLEPLGSMIMLEPKGEQLSGLGFNATVKDEVVLRLQGTHKRVVKVKF